MTAERVDAVRADLTERYGPVNYNNYGIYVAGELHARDLAGRDVLTKGAGGEQGPARRRSVRVLTIAPDEAQRLSKVLVQVGQRRRAEEVLREHRLVVLQGASGSGKGTAALSLLGLEHEIDRVDPSVTIKELTDFEQQFPAGEDRRYVVETLSPETARSLNAFVVRAVRRGLEERRGLLVLTVDARVPLSAELTTYVVPWHERPDPSSALRRHLALSLDAGQVVALESRYDLEPVQACLAERNMRDVEGMARVLVRAFHDGRTQEQVLQDIGYGARARVEEWFAAGPDTEDVAFLLAATVLGGCTYKTVVGQARRLEGFISRGARLKPSRRPRDPLLTRGRRLRDTMSLVEDGFVDTVYGRIPAETVVLESAGLPKAVLEVVWHDYDLLAEALIGWLDELGDDADPWVALRAAVAAGHLAQHDFAVVSERLLLPWALGSTNAALAAADALGPVAAEESTTPLALALLTVWATSDVYDLWWTAATACGGDAGVFEPEFAMRLLLDVARRHDPRASAIAAHSAVRLVEGGGRFVPAIGTHVLGRLTTWLEVDAWSASTARLGYAELLARAGDLERPSSPGCWDAVTSRANRTVSARLLRATLGEQTFRQDALESLQAMVRQADVEPTAGEDLQELLLLVGTGDGSTRTDRDRLLHYLGRWATGTRPSAAARAMADRIGGHGA